MNKLKLTLAAAALTLSLNAAAAPLPVPQVDLSSLLDAGTSLFSEQARGFRMSRPAYRNFGGSGARSSSRSSSSSANTNNTNARTNNQQQDAQFSRTSPYRNNAAPGSAAMPAYTGSPFLSSLTGTMTGMLLANMLFGSTAHASSQTPAVTPESLTDDELKECIATLDSKMTELETARGDILNSSAEDKDAQLAQLDKDQQQLKDLQLRLLKEQIDRLQ